MHLFGLDEFYLAYKAEMLIIYLFRPWQTVHQLRKRSHHEAKA